MKDFNNLQGGRESIPTKNVNKRVQNSNIGHDFAAETNAYSGLEEKIAELSLQVNQVIVRPYLQQALDYLKTSKFDSINAYNQLSDQVANEVRIISSNSHEIANRLDECQKVIQRTQEIIRNKYNNATEEEIASGSLDLEYEYNIVAEHHELAIKLTQEMSRYKTRIDSLLTSQNLLDDSIVPTISRVQLEIDNLELLLHNFDSSNYSDILARKQGRNAGAKMRTTPALEARGDLLSQYAQDVAVQNNQMFSNKPNLEDMRRYEDPNRQAINMNSYPYQNISQRPMNNQQMQQPVPMSRKEMKMQKKLAKQQMLMQQQAAYQQPVQTPYYEGQMDLNTVNDYVKNSKNDKLFVVRKGSDIPEQNVEKIKNPAYKNDSKGNLRSIKVVK